MAEKTFVEAAACGDIADIKRMLADSSTSPDVINACDKDGRSALHYACLNDDMNLLPLLLEDDRVNLSLTTPNGEGIFHMAALYASLEALKLLGSHARVSAVLVKNKSGKDVKLIDATNKYGETALHLCSGSGDKNAPKAVKLLLENGASLLEVDQWNRGPLACAALNGEKQTAKVIEEWLKDQDEALKRQVRANTDQVLTERANFVKDIYGQKKNIKARPPQLLQGIAGLKVNLKKTTTVEKHMFNANQGKVTDAKAKTTLTPNPNSATSQKILSKLIEFPGDREQISKLVKDPEVDVAGKDMFGLSALHKFASWNKPELIEMILPQLSPEQLNEPDLDGKTALHWACEMASVATVSFLVGLEVDKNVKDKKGRTPMDILNSGTGSVIDRLKKALEGN